MALAAGGIMDFPKFHENLLTISLYHRQTILEKYSDILGLNNIDHISVNVIDPNGKLVFLSSTPATGINVCSNKLYLNDFSIHPSMYLKKEFYWWEACYAPQMKTILKREKEEKNQLSHGFIVTEHKNGFTFLYSFATKKKKDLEAWLLSENYLYLYKQMGRYCFNRVKNLYIGLTENEVDFTL
jgi:hypothetical protein